MTAKERHRKLVEDWKYITSTYGKPDMAEIDEMCRYAIFGDNLSLDVASNIVAIAIEAAFVRISNRDGSHQTGDEWTTLPVDQDKRLQQIKKRWGV
jgi:hypothetical protein